MRLAHHLSLCALGVAFASLLASAAWAEDPQTFFELNGTSASMCSQWTDLCTGTSYHEDWYEDDNGNGVFDAGDRIKLGGNWQKMLLVGPSVHMVDSLGTSYVVVCPGAAGTLTPPLPSTQDGIVWPPPWWPPTPYCQWLWVLWWDKSGYHLDYLHMGKYGDWEFPGVLSIGDQMLLVGDVFNGGRTLTVTGVANGIGVGPWPTPVSPSTWGKIKALFKKVF